MVLSLENEIKLPDRIDGIKVSDILLDVFNEILLLEIFEIFQSFTFAVSVNLQGYCKLHNTTLKITSAKYLLKQYVEKLRQYSKN